MKKAEVSIVIPMFNERESIPELVRALESAFKTRPVEYIFIDDGSTDGSYDALCSLQKKLRHASTIVKLRKRSGKSVALAEGFARIKGDVVVTLDADLQDDPREVPALLTKLNDGYDLVVGWRRYRNDSKGKLGVSYVFNWIVSWFTGLALHDMNSGLKVMTAEVVREIDLYGQLHRFIPVLASARGFKVTEVPIAHHARKYGQSKFGLERAFAAFDLVTTLFLSGYGTRPLMVFGPPGAILVTAGLIALTYLSYLHFMGQSIGTRPLLLLGVLFVLFGVQLLSTGLLGELISSMATARKRPPVRTIHEHSV